MHNDQSLQKTLGAKPLRNSDGSISATILHRARKLGEYTLLELSIPGDALSGSAFGRFVMARCGRSDEFDVREDWSIYLRRPLFVCGVRSLPDTEDVVSVILYSPNVDDSGYRWLIQRSAGDTVNLLGPFGRETRLPANAKHLLILASSKHAPLSLPLIDAMLDRNGQVTLLVRGSELDDGLRSLLPLSVEVQTGLGDQWIALALESISWADALFIADENLSPQQWADLIRQRRLTLDESFAFCYMRSDLLCCTGACMACVVPRSDGSLTRACVHGPVFALTDLIR